MPKSLLFAACLSTLACATQASVSVVAPSFSYSQNFDTLTLDSVASSPWANDNTLAGWSLFNRNLQPRVSIIADDGNRAQGTFRSYGVAGVQERALGGTAAQTQYFAQATQGQLAGWIAVAFTNDTVADIAKFTVAYDGEQWRTGGNGVAHAYTVEYGFGPSFDLVFDWQLAGASFNIVSPVVSTSAGPVDGNGAGRIAGLGGTISTVWAVGDTVWLRWAEINEVGNDDALAIDNFSFTVGAPVPEPSSWALLLAGLGGVGYVARRRSSVPRSLGT